jgi:hypothetical protein
MAVVKGASEDEQREVMVLSEAYDEITQLQDQDGIPEL